MTDSNPDSGSRYYICTECDVIVHARWSGPGGFEVGCDCTIVPIVPQVGQDETPSNWRVVRPDCCRGAENADLEKAYGEDWSYTCGNCNAGYTWDGKMVSAPEKDVRPAVSLEQRTLKEKL